ncbi:MAG: hypothetical protein RLZZ502_1133 [Pseudomonadota bacterium]|jgi:triosephosphate isomerase
MTHSLNPLTKPQKWLIGNWKMHGNLTANESLLTALKSAGASDRYVLAVCPPAVYLSQVATLLKNSHIQYGLQDLSAQMTGAFTGQISADMAKDFGAQLALLGHSERRHGLGESNALVAAKTLRCLQAGMTAVLCVGETLQERESGQEEVVVAAQLSEVLGALHNLGSQANNLVIAYEPVWAIGTGKTASPEQAQAMHAFIRRQLTQANAAHLPILYGGSVKAANAAELFAQADIDGGLIGGASLVASDFLAIASAL